RLGLESRIRTALPPDVSLPAVGQGAVGIECRLDDARTQALLAHKGNTISTPRGDVVHLDLRHLGEKKLHERLPFICELAKAYVGV
ncbi:hypothetical protein MJL81_29685, partial [Salmonella enterica subsp. enterica serovar Anatum]|nr:hypothetical protein [Salmonella enterica subsp. enterica serovar Anatum]